MSEQANAELLRLSVERRDDLMPSMHEDVRQKAKCLRTSGVGDGQYLLDLHKGKRLDAWR